MAEFLGKYRIDGTLGKGAMGVVYRAFDPGIGRVVALKTVRKEVLEAGERDDLLERFRNEARAAGRLLHPNIVTVHDYGEDDRSSYIVMELVEGRGLDALLEKDRPTPVGQACRWLEQLLGALQYAHARGVVHRDIKPANLMILDDGTLKVTDFGIARLESSNLTQLGTQVGTPSYMSPEQVLGDTLDGRSDLFSAGVLFYQLLTGEKPFAGNAVTVMHQILSFVPRPPSELNPALPAALDEIVARAIAKRPSERYATAEAFRAALLATGLHQRAPQGDARLGFDADGTVLVRPQRSPKHPPDATNTVPDAAASSLPASGQAVPQPAAPAVPNGGHGRGRWIAAGAVTVALAIGAGLSLAPKPPPPAPAGRVAADTAARTDPAGQLSRRSPASAAPPATLHDALAREQLAPRLATEPPTRSTIYRAGEKMILSVTARDAPAYLYVDYYTADGNVVHLLPNAQDADNFLKAGGTRVIGEKPHRTFTIGGPQFGDEVVVATASPLPLFQGLPRPLSESVAAYVAALGPALRVLGPAEAQVGSNELFIHTEK